MGLWCFFSSIFLLLIVYLQINYVNYGTAQRTPFPGSSYYDEDTMAEPPFGALFFIATKAERAKSPYGWQATMSTRVFWYVFFSFVFIYSILIIYGQTTCTNNNDGFGSDRNKWQRRWGSRRVLEPRCVFILLYIYISTNTSLTQHFDSSATSRRIQPPSRRVQPPLPRR